MVERNLVTDKNVLTLTRLAQLESGAAADHIYAVINEMADGIWQRKLAGLAIDDRQKDHRKAFLHLRVLVELVEHNLRLCPALQLNDDAHSVAVALIAHVTDIVNRLVIDQLGDTLDKRVLVDLIRDLADDDRLPALRQVFDGAFSTHQEASTPRLVRLRDAAPPVDEAPSREVRPLNMLQHFGQPGMWIVHHLNGGIDDFRQIVRRDVGRHADGDAVRAINDEVRNARGQHRRLIGGLVIIGNEVHSLLINVGQQLAGNAHHAALGVTHGRRRVSIY